MIRAAKQARTNARTPALSAEGMSRVQSDNGMKKTTKGVGRDCGGLRQARRGLQRAVAVRAPHRTCAVTTTMEQRARRLIALPIGTRNIRLETWLEKQRPQAGSHGPAASARRRWWNSTRSRPRCGDAARRWRCRKTGKATDRVTTTVGVFCYRMCSGGASGFRWTRYAVCHSIASRTAPSSPRWKEALYNSL